MARPRFRKVERDQIESNRQGGQQWRSTYGRSHRRRSTFECPAIGRNVDLSVATQVGRSLSLRSVVSMRSRWVHRLPSHTWSMILPNRSTQIHRVPNHNSKMVLSIVHFGPPLSDGAQPALRFRIDFAGQSSHRGRRTQETQAGRRYRNEGLGRTSGIAFMPEPCRLGVGTAHQRQRGR